MLKEIFQDSFENFNIYWRICVENHAMVPRWQKLFFSYKYFELLAAVAVATFEMHCWKFSGFVILICSFSLADKILQKWTVFMFTESWSHNQLMQRAYW